MKRILPHPPRLERPTMWRSLSELEGSPEFDEILEREFPRGADVYEDSGLSKRDFLKLMGASMTLAGVGLAGCRRPEAFIVPMKEGVEWTIPGKFLYYATSMPTRLGAIPLIASTVDGRPTKLEGNPLHPASNGGTDGFAQASVLDLYDPFRAKAVKKGGVETDAAAFETFLGEVIGAASANGGAGLAVLVERSVSPTRDRLRDELKAKYPGLLWAEYEPLGNTATMKADAAAFGAGVRVTPNFDQADVILALDSDFLNCGETGVSFADGFYRRRNPDQEDGRPMNRLYVAESYYTVTGGLADHRIRVKASEIGAFARALAEKIGAAANSGALAAYPQSNVAFDDAWLTGVAEDLLAHRGRSLVLAGPQQPWQVQALAHSINAALGNVGTILEGTRTAAVADASIQELAAAMASGSVQTLFVVGGNPIYNAPGDLDFATLFSKVPTTVRMGLFEDETGKAATWMIPAAHYLESWGDALAHDGTYTSVQPMVLPLWNGMPELDLYALLLGRPRPEGPELVRETFTALTGTSGDVLAEQWNEFLRNGFLPDSAYAAASLAFNSDSIATAMQQEPLAANARGTELVFTRSSSVDDGRYANNSWLQETPDFVTKLTWDNAALVSPAFAKALGVKDGDMLEISGDGTAMQIAALIAPGQADDSVSIALGYGRSEVSALMENIGFNAYPLRTTTAMRARTGISVRKADAKRYRLARTQEYRSMDGRDLAREGTLDRYKHEPEFPKTMGMDGHLPPEISLYRNPYFQPPPDTPGLPTKEQWAMTIDLNTCTGCNACVVACQSENNVPVVGKDQVIKGRDMAWIRIDRYFASVPGKESEDAVEAAAEDPEMLAQVITCQHCENAPCETVCPVNATVHSEDGLNLMAYNRCIGTRYCANNCPWKVRRFNYFDYNSRPLDKLYFGPLAPKGMTDSLKLSKNPNVTVRMRGVMEKCTFCIQRIEDAKIARLVQAGPSSKRDVPMGQFKVACEQACPSGSIVFGNEADETSRVHKLRQDPRGWKMLGYLNTRPRITYLARIKNPNMKMPGAEKVGNINSPAHGHGEVHAAMQTDGVGPTHFDGHGTAPAAGEEAQH
jgi:MoCo/4Fe-4S cofactor protein with predicted Tat translocation signal